MFKEANRLLRYFFIYRKKEKRQIVEQKTRIHWKIYQQLITPKSLYKP